MLDCLLLGFILEEDFVSIIYYFKFVYLVQDLFFEAGEIEILDLYGLYHIWGKCNIWYSMVIKRTDFKDFHLMCIETPVILHNKTHKIKVFVPVLMRFCNIEDFR